MGFVSAGSAAAVPAKSDFDAVHVVSDLHLADEPGSEIFKGSALLAGMIRRISTEHAGERAALVVNGDFVDFLAARKPTYFDTCGAVEKLHAVITSHADIWAAFREFVADPAHRLVIVLGNHDLEFFLDEVRRELINSIAEGSPAVQARIELSFEGSGFPATVGGARVLCVHGNEVDTFNKVDYERLRRIERDRRFGFELDPWVPNAGTRLVIDVMNGIKQNLPFVDLLKPETEGVLPILFALNQANRERLRKVFAVGTRYAWDAGRSALGLLSGAEPPRSGGEESFETFLQSTLPRSIGAAGEREAALLADAEDRFRRGVHPLELVASQRDSRLGYFAATWKALSGAKTAEVLREALESLRRDQSFDPFVPDQTFRDLDRLLPEKLDFVIAGHTHLERVLNRPCGKGVYMNTGTWARLIRLRPDDLISPQRFEPVYQALQAKTMAELEQATPSRVDHRPALASVWAENGSVQHALRRVKESGGRVELTAVG